MAEIRIVIVDDDRLVASSLKTILSAGGVDVAATGGSTEEAVSLYNEYKPDILLMDIRMGKRTGLDAAEEILSADSTAKILFLTTFADDEYIIKALKIGAKGYLLKQGFESIIPSLNAVMSGQTVFGEEIITKLPVILGGDNEQQMDTDASACLSDKEREIITEVAKGLSNKEISASLFLSEGTVRNYISVILEKLDLRDRTQLAIYYYRSMKP